MRLWPIKLLPYLPRQQLLGQHRECCALRGKGWGRKHATVDYVFDHPYFWLALYHFEVMHEMRNRGYLPWPEWWDRLYRGKRIGRDLSYEFDMVVVPEDLTTIYPEHNATYLAECLENLRRKGVLINMTEI